MDDLRFLDPEALVNRAAFNERFGMLNDLMFGLGNQYLWQREIVSYEEKLGDVITSDTKFYSSTNYDWQFTFYSSDTISIDSAGVVSLVAPIATTVTRADYNPFYSNAKNRYFTLHQSGGPIYRGENNLSARLDYEDSGSSTTYIFEIQNVRLVGSEQVLTLDGYVNSSSPDTYPPAEPDGYTYTALGQLGNKVQIETGSYTGTGTYGSSNPNSLTFGFEPKLAIVFENPKSTSPKVLFLFPGGFGAGFNEAKPNVTSGVFAVISTFNNKKINWYYTNSAALQMNISEQNYDYIVLG